MFPQDGVGELLSAAAGGGEPGLTALLSALVLWPQARRQEGRGPPVPLCGHGNHVSASAPRVFPLLACLLTCLLSPPVLSQVVVLRAPQPHISAPLGCADESAPFSRILGMKEILVSLEVRSNHLELQISDSADVFSQIPSFLLEQPSRLESKGTPNLQEMNIRFLQ